MKAFTKLGIVLFIFILSGCAVITNFDGVLALKRLGDSQRDNENYLKRQEKLFYRLVSDIKANRLEKGLSEQRILSKYGQPVLSQHRKVYNVSPEPPPDLLGKSKRLGLRKSPITGDNKSSPKAIFLKPVEDNSQIKEVFVYRHPMQYFSSGTIELYFNERKQLYSWEFKPFE
ncbi:MAG: hypothetical protein V2A64_03550 [Candidatus Omnitrophota bacterium]